MATERLAECAQLQRDEIEILQSIFHDQEISVTKVTCKKYGVQTWLVRLQLTPPLASASQSGPSGHTSNAIFASIDLHVRFSGKYPDEVPKITLKNAKGLSTEQVTALEARCLAVANSSVGEVMCMQVVEVIRSCLHDNNRPPVGSFFEQMNERKARERELAAESERHQAEEEKRKAEIFYETVRSALNDDESDDEAGARTGGSYEIGCSERSHKRVRFGELLDVSGTNRGSTTTGGNRVESIGVVVLRCDAQTRSGRIHRLRAFEMSNGRFTTLTEWHIPTSFISSTELLSGSISTEASRRFITSLKPVLTVNHENLLRYVAVGVNTRFRVFNNDQSVSSGLLHVPSEHVRQSSGEADDQEIEQEQDASSCRFYVLQEIPSGFVSVHEHLVEARCGSPRNLLRAYVRQLMSAYAYLHGRALRVGAIRPADLLVRNTELRIADYSLNANVPRLLRRGVDLVELASLCRLDETSPSQKQTPNAANSISARAADLNRLAQLVLTMATGIDFCAAHESVALRVSDIPESVSTQLRLFIVELLSLASNQSEKTEISALNSHAFFTTNEPEGDADFRGKHKKVLFGGTAIAHTPADAKAERRRAKSESSESGDGSDANKQEEWSADTDTQQVRLAVSQSRFEADYEAIRVIGKGGFGAVVQAKHRLDGQMYAVKRICMVGGRIRFDEKVRREVRLLSRLNHENVVRYYNAWLEDAFDAGFSSNSTSYSTQTTSPAAVPRRAPFANKAETATTTETKSKTNLSPGTGAGTTNSTGFSSPDEHPVAKRRDLTRLNILGLPEDDIEANAPPPVSQDVDISLCVDDCDTSSSSSASSQSSSSESESESESESDSEDKAKQTPKTTKKPVASESSSSGQFQFEKPSKAAGVSDETETSEPPTDSIPANAQKQPAATAAAQTHKLNLMRPEYLSNAKLLYIQMEYCEKRTLTSAIDEGRLVGNPERVWKMLREIAEGLNYVHEQGIIHRDLKPGNIFIDSNDHVKIGDFGLATLANALQKARKSDGETASTIAASQTAAAKSGQLPTLTTPTTTGSDLTTQVGTKLYIAPEVLAVAPTASAPDAAPQRRAKARYDQKVDMFSLGVILFEMCMPPFRTAMHRIESLVSVRNEPTRAASLISPSMSAPPQTGSASSAASLHLTLPSLIQSLLAHDPVARPSSADLLSRLPLAESTKRERELLSFVKNGGSIRKLMEALFDRETPPKLNQAGFDADADEMSAFGAASSSLHSKAERERVACASTLDRAILTASLAAVCRQVFALHGYTEFSTPLLMLNDLDPRESTSAGLNRAVYVDRLGQTITLPYDLRTRFARFVANNAALTELRRFDINRVFRERRVRGLHPQESWECVFDYLLRSPSPLSANVLSFFEAEMMQMAFEILQSLPAARDRYEVVVSHSDLLRAVLLYHGIPESKHDQIRESIHHHRTGNADSHFMRSVTQHCEQTLSEQTLQVLHDFLCLEDTYSNVASSLKRLTNAKQAIAQLGILVSYLTDCLEVRVPIRVRVVMNLGSAYSSRPCSYDRGVNFRVLETTAEAGEKEKDKRGGKSRKDSGSETIRPDRVVAAGGHFEPLVSRYAQDYSLFDSVRPAAKSLSTSGASSVVATHLFAFGVTIYFDRLVEITSSSFVNAWSKLAPSLRGSAPASFFHLHRYDILLVADSQRDRDESSRAADPTGTCRFATKSMLADVLRVACRLWEAGYRVRVAATCWNEHSPLFAAQDDAPAQYSTIIFYSSSEYDNVRVRSVYRKDGDVVTMNGREYREVKVSKNCIVDHVKQNIPMYAHLPSSNPFTKHIVPFLQASRSTESPGSLTGASVMQNASTVQSQAPSQTSGSAGNTASGASANASLSASRINVSFALEDRKSAHDKRRLEGQVIARLGANIASLSAKARVEVLCVNLLKDVLKSCAAYLELGSEEEFDASLKLVFEKNTRARAYLTNVMEEIRKLRFDKNCNVLVLYSVKDDFLKVIFC